MGLGDRLKAMAELGSGELRGAYQEKKQEIKAKADAKRQLAKTKIGLARIKADEAKEMADLEAAMYQAQIAAQNAQKRAKQLRHQAGHFTVGERLGQAGRGAAGVGVGFVRGMMNPDAAARRATERITGRPVKRTARRK